MTGDCADLGAVSPSKGLAGGLANVDVEGSRLREVLKRQPEPLPHLDDCLLAFAKQRMFLLPELRQRRERILSSRIQNCSPRWPKVQTSPSMAGKLGLQWARAISPNRLGLDMGKKSHSLVRLADQSRPHALQVNSASAKGLDKIWPSRIDDIVEDLSDAQSLPISDHVHNCHGARRAVLRCGCKHLAEHHTSHKVGPQLVECAATDRAGVLARRMRGKIYSLHRSASPPQSFKEGMHQLMGDQGG